MKRIIDKYLGWLKDSNRPKHILCGLLVYAAMMAVCLIMGNTFASSAIISLVVEKSIRSLYVPLCAVSLGERLYPPLG